MANTFLEVKRIAAEALPILVDNLVTPNLFYRDYSNTFANQGDTIQVERPVVFIADEFGGTINLQDLTEKSVFVKMDKIADVSFEINQTDLALSAQDFATKYLESAASAIAEQINANGLDLYQYVNSYEGTSGTTPASLDVFADARKRLNINKVPMGMRHAIWDPNADAKLGNVDAIVNLEKSGSNAALREGSIGNIKGMDNFMSQAVKTHTAGGFTALADVTADVTAASNGTDATTNFGYSNAVLTSSAGTSTDKLLKGDLLSFADANGNVKQFTVIEDTAAAVDGVVTAKVYPALDADVSGEEVTFPDVSAGGHVANLAFHEKAFAYVSRQLPPFPDKQSFTTEYNGISLRVTIWSDGETKKTKMSVDCLYGFAPLYPELATRYLG